MSDKIIRILLIEDNPDDARVIRQMLADMATADPIAPTFDLTRARRLSSGLRRLAAEGFDALLLDLSLPDSQGLDTFVKAQAQTPQIPIIVLSDLDEELALEAVQKGAQDYLVKGEASASMLVYAIRHAIEHKQAEKALKEQFSTLRSIIDSADAFIFSLDRQYRYTSFNEGHAAVMKALYGAEIQAGHNMLDYMTVPEDREIAKRNLDRALAGEQLVEEAYSGEELRSRRYFRVSHSPIKTEDGQVIGVAVLAHDMTERKRAEQERLAHLRFLESMDQVNRAMQGASDLEQMMSDVLDAVQDIFDCDRAGLVYPCDPEEASWKVPMERTRPEYPGAHALGIEIPTDPDVAQTFRIMRASDGPVKFGPESEHPLPPEVAERFGFKSFIAMALYPKVGKPWEFVLHQCSYPRVWTPQEERLFQEIGRRLADGLTSLLVYRDLQESELRYREIFENTSDVIVITEVTKDGRFRLLDFNPAWETIIGLSRTELVGRYLEDFGTDETARTVLEQYHVCLEKKAPMDFETGLLTATGHWHLHTTLIPVSNAAGNIYRLVGVSRDITKRKRAEETLRASEEQLQLALDAAQMGQWDWNIVTGEVVWSQQCLALYGLPPDTLMSYDRFLQALHPEDRGRIDTALRRAVEDRTSYDEPKRTVWPDGSIHWTASRGQVYCDAMGQPIHMTGVTFDITEWKEAQEAVRESETRYRAVVEAFDGLIYICSQDYRVEFMNKQLLERTGYDGTGELCYKVLHDLDSVCPWCVNDRVFAGETVRWEIQSPKDNHWYYVVNTPIYHADGSMSKQAMILDITERKQVEEALRQSEERFRALYEDNPSMYFMVDAQGTVLSVNPFGAGQLGYAVEELIGQSVLNVFYPDDREAVQQQLTACLEHPGQVAHWEFRKVRQDGSMLWVREAARAVQGADGRPVVLIVCEDITERRQAEAEREHLLAQIQEQARRVQEIMDTVPEGVLLLDADCRVLLANPLGQRDLATLANAQVGDILTLLGDRSLAELLASPPKGLWHEVAAERRSFQAIARPIEDDPTPKGWVLVIRDVTQQREVERRIQQQERLAALGQLAAGIAHDFNNIIAVISLYAGMSLRITDLPSLVYERLEIVDQQARRASDLVQQVLDFSRRAVLERGAMDLLTFLKEQINLLKRTLPESIEVKLVYDEGKYTVNADPTRMQQAIMNLATNARDAMPQGGRLSFGLERIHVRDRASAPLPDMEAGDWICVTITDTGAGIPPDVLPHIFEPFFTTKAEGRGTGLGLAQVYGIINQHEGTIDVKAEVGAGTTFMLYLPALAVPQPPPSPSRIEQLPQGHGETVLVVEDDTVARQAVVSGLETLGYQVLQAANGLEALDVFEQHADKVELVLSDVVMPEMGGRSLLHTLRQRDPAVRIVLLTGHPLEDKEFEDLRTLGLREWTLKPLSIEQLAQITAQALGNAEHK